MRRQQEQNEAQQYERDVLFGPCARRNCSPPATTSVTNPNRGRSRYNTPTEHSSSGNNGDWDAAAAGQGEYEQQQQLSWAQVRDGIDVDERRRGLRSAHESAETGRATLESLQDQKGRACLCVCFVNFLPKSIQVAAFAE